MADKVYILNCEVNDMNVMETINALYMEKTALNAQKARAMAYNAGLFPEGQWRWALRKLRDSRGNLLQGKAMADKKLEMGAIRNNDYQNLKQFSNHYTAGSYSGSPYAHKGTEIGGALHTNPVLRGKIVDMDIGYRGTGSVDPGTNARDIIEDNLHSFHTHPSVGRIALVNEVRQRIVNARGKLLDESWKQDNPIAAYKLPAELQKHEHNLKRFNKSGRNPLLTEPSGNVQIFSGSRRKLAVGEGDKGAFLARAKKDNNGTLDSIFAPHTDIEGIHKVKDTGKLRSIYFDRSPRKAR